MANTHIRTHINIPLHVPSQNMQGQDVHASGNARALKLIFMGTRGHKEVCNPLAAGILSVAAGARSIRQRSSAIQGVPLIRHVRGEPSKQSDRTVNY